MQLKEILKGLGVGAVIGVCVTWVMLIGVALARDQHHTTFPASIVTVGIIVGLFLSYLVGMAIDRRSYKVLLGVLLIPGWVGIAMLLRHLAYIDDATILGRTGSGSFWGLSFLVMIAVFALLFALMRWRSLSPVPDAP